MSAMCHAAALPPMREGDVNYRQMRVFDDASWVRHSAGQGAKFFRFRNDFDSDGTPLAMHVSADERYVLFLDGEEISRGPARGMPSRWFCQKVTASPWPGRRRLEAVVWTLGEDAPRAQLTNGGGFFLKAEGPYDGALTTGKGRWRAAPLFGTETAGRTYPGAFGGGTQFKVFGSSVLSEEPASELWADVKCVSSPPGNSTGSGGVVPPGWAVYESILPEMIMRHVKPGEIPKRKIAVPAHAKRRWLFDLGDYYCAYPYLTVSGGKGATVRFGFAEALVDAEGRKLHRDSRDGLFTQAYVDTFLPDGRAGATFAVPWWRCGKWCMLEVETGDDPLSVDDVTLVETRYPLAKDGSFSAEGDDSLAAIARMCERGVEMCAHEIMFDCPFYEQQM